MKTITVTDPVSRIEGQVEVKLSIDTSGGQHRIVDAHCRTPRPFDVETLLNNSSSLAPKPAERICAAYPISHIMAAVLALENVSNWLPSTNARLLRNLTLGATFLQSHILHFYLFATLDYVTCPAASPWKPDWQTDIRPGLDRVAANLPAALGARRRAHELGNIFGQKISGFNTITPGGFKSIPTIQDIDNYRVHLKALTEFIDSIYLPDVQLIGTAYSDYFAIGTGCRNFIAFGAFEMDDTNTGSLFRSGYTENGSSDVQPLKIMKDINKTNELTPIESDRKFLYEPVYSAPWPGFSRLRDTPFEGGPLARMWINGDYQRTISVMDRHVARALEAAKIAAAMNEWLDDLTPGESAYDNYFDQRSGRGIGLSEAPCGPVGHSVKITDGDISAYQKFTPACRHEAPTHGHDVTSPLERALIGTVIENPDRPIEALRVIHSYDPCLSYAVQNQEP